VTLFEISTLIVGIATVVAVFLQFRVASNSVKLAAQALKADHERRKKQATIDYVKEIRVIWRETRVKLEKKYGTESLSKEALEEINSNIDTNAIVKNLLGSLEHMSVGMNTGVYDKDLLFRMSGQYLINMYHRMRPYIEERRKENPIAFIEFHELIHDFEERKRKKPSMVGNIEHS
jgi:hypothetical protein